jgi:hypothetical protein
MGTRLCHTVAYAAMCTAVKTRVCSSNALEQTEPRVQGSEHARGVRVPRCEGQINKTRFETQVGSTAPKSLLSGYIHNNCRAILTCALRVSWRSNLPCVSRFWTRNSRRVRLAQPPPPVGTPRDARASRPARLRINRIAIAVRKLYLTWFRPDAEVSLPLLQPLCFSP